MAQLMSFEAGDESGKNIQISSLGNGSDLSQQFVECFQVKFMVSLAENPMAAIRRVHVGLRKSVLSILVSSIRLYHKKVRDSYAG